VSADVVTFGLGRDRAFFDRFINTYYATVIIRRVHWAYFGVDPYPLGANLVLEGPCAGSRGVRPRVAPSAGNLTSQNALL